MKMAEGCLLRDAADSTVSSESYAMRLFANQNPIQDPVRRDWVASSVRRGMFTDGQAETRPPSVQEGHVSR
jgi:hypothetical protein